LAEGTRICTKSAIVSLFRPTSVGMKRRQQANTIFIFLSRHGQIHRMKPPSIRIGRLQQDLVGRNNALKKKMPGFLQRPSNDCDRNQNNLQASQEKWTFEDNCRKQKTSCTRRCTCSLHTYLDDTLLDEAHH